MAVNHVTIEARQWIEGADIVLCFDLDPVVERWIRTLNDRVEAPEAILEQTLTYVRTGHSVIAVHDGYATVSARSCRQAVQRARDEGYAAFAIASISPVETLFADLLLDPWQSGVQIYDCAHFVLQKRRPDTSVGLVLRNLHRVQPALPYSANTEQRCERSIVDALSTFYDLEHEVVLHGAARYAVCQPMVQTYRIGQLTQAAVTAESILYVPPAL